jgi:tetratricopeptide (TPR) repeat protein/predicted Ser/Thr protein kinase
MRSMSYWLVMAGGRISYYELQAKLGQGGMGIVYRAVDTRLGRVVALKMIPRDALGREDLRRRMLREARAAAMLNHPNVCTVYDVDDAQGFLVMECIEGAPLNELLRAGPVNVQRALHIARQVASGLLAAHERGIVHRDIKPANIMLTASGQVKITDFGLAKCSGESHLTLTGQVLGTPAYMSPEQIRGCEADARSDIWSFGVLLHELLTGSLPFHGDNMTSLLYSIVHEDPMPLPSTVGPERTHLQSLINRCLVKAPDERYQRMIDVAAELGAVLHDGLHASIAAGRAESGAVSTAGPTVTLDWPLGGTPSIAVIDFDNESGDSSLDWLSIAVAETLTSDLRRIGKLRVIDRQQVIRTVRRTGTEATALGAELGIRSLIAGRVTSSPAGIQIVADLRDCLSGLPVLRLNEQGPLDHVLSLLANISIRIAEGIGLDLTEQDRRRLEDPETGVLDAYRLYAKGKRLFYTFDFDKMEEARQTFENAAKADPRYALSWAGIGTIYAFRYIKTTDARDLHTGIGYLRQAINVDANLAEAYTSLAYAHLRLRDFNEGIRTGTRAVELEPTSTAAHYFLAANYLGSTTEGRNLEHFTPAIEHFAESVRIEPNYQPGLMMHGWALMLRGEHEEALPVLTRAAEVERTGRFDVMQMVGAQTLLALVQYRSGNTADAEQSFRRSVAYLESKAHLYRDLFLAFSHCGLADIRLEQRVQDEAIEEFSKAQAAIDRSPNGLGIGYAALRVLTGLARTFHKLGMGREARDHLERGTYLYTTKSVYDFHMIWEGCDAQACYDLSRSCAVLDQRDAAIRWLQEATAAGWHDPSFLRRDESMKSLLTSGRLQLNAILGGKALQQETLE